LPMAMKSAMATRSTLLVLLVALVSPLEGTRLRTKQAEQETSFEQEQMMRQHEMLVQKLSRGLHLPSFFSGANATARVAEAPSSGGCVPQCTWECQTPKCNQACTPKCQPPRCETRCAKADTSSCQMACEEQPHCAVVCPKNPADGTECSTTCTKPLCHLSCPGVQPCKSVCEHPKCEWECSAPTSCPKPVCQMKCSTPASCGKSVTYHEELPPPAEDETSLSSAFGQVPVAAVRKDTAVLSAKEPAVATTVAPPVLPAIATTVAPPVLPAIAAASTKAPVVTTSAKPAPAKLTTVPQVMVKTQAVTTTAAPVVATTVKVTSPPTTQPQEKVFRLSLFPTQDDAKKPELFSSSQVSGSVVDGFMQTLLR